jgi:hypothetical protein
MQHVGSAFGARLVTQIDARAFNADDRQDYDSEVAGWSRFWIGWKIDKLVDPWQPEGREVMWRELAQRGGENIVDLCGRHGGDVGFAKSLKAI